MSTQNWSSAIDLTGTTGFRAMGTEFNAKVAATTLMVQTADTGQINWTTVTIPGVGVDAGYEIWKLNDSLFGTAPVFFKFTYGLNPSGNWSLKIIHGTATDGAGNLSGVLSAAVYCSYQYSAPPVSPTQVFDSYLCAAPGFFGFYYKVTPSANTPLGVDASFFFTRTCDTTGAMTAEGAYLYGPDGNVGTSIYVQSLRYAATAQAFTPYTNSMTSCLVTQNPASSLDASGNNQAYKWYTRTPNVEALATLCTILSADASQGTQFTCALVGATPRNFIVLRPQPHSSNGAGMAEVSGNVLHPYTIAMLWE